ncbi:MAG: mechanosensitive ion channel family protein [Nocardioides sp.]|nr:mechanosensitive ion channel family protein [Nocardioides sp.]
MPAFGLDLALTGSCSPDAQICGAVEDLTGSQRAANVADILVGKPLALLGLFLLFLVVRWLVTKIIDRIVYRAETGVLPDRVGRLSLGHVKSAAIALDPSTSARRAQRAKTMGSLLKSIVTGLLVAIIGTMMLSEIGLNIAPILASAGVLGLAIGFGAQSLVKDFLSGIFLIVEDQFGVGDTVDLGEAVGVVEAVSLRVTRLRDVNGTVWYVPNGEILRVGNQSQNWSRTVLDIGVAYTADLVKVRRVLEEVAHGMWDDEDFEGKVIEEPSVWGVQDLTPDAVTMRLVLKTTPGEQWLVAREMRERIKARFEQEHIDIPLPQRFMLARDQAGGEAAAGRPAADGRMGT